MAKKYSEVEELYGIRAPMNKKDFIRAFVIHFMAHLAAHGSYKKSEIWVAEEAWRKAHIAWDDVEKVCGDSF